MLHDYTEHLTNNIIVKGVAATLSDLGSYDYVLLPAHHHAGRMSEKGLYSICSVTSPDNVNALVSLCSRQVVWHETTQVSQTLSCNLASWLPYSCLLVLGDNQLCILMIQSSVSGMMYV